jgi:intraflagellar transport protein 52
LTSEALQKQNLLIVGGPKSIFTNDEFEVMSKYLEEGGSILILLGESGDQK